MLLITHNHTDTIFFVPVLKHTTLTRQSKHVSPSAGDDTPLRTPYCRPVRNTLRWRTDSNHVITRATTLQTLYRKLILQYNSIILNDNSK